MLWVATMGMHFGCRERLKNFSSPVGSLSPTVAKCWYSSQRKRTWRKCLSGFASISGTRLSTARSKSSFIITPMAFAKPGFMPFAQLGTGLSDMAVFARQVSESESGEIGCTLAKHLSGDGHVVASHHKLFGFVNSLFEERRRDRAFVHVEESHVVVGHFVQQDDE